MKRAKNREELNSALDSPHVNGDHSDHLLDDARIKQLADEQEASRKQFDAVIARSSSDWQSITDPTVLSNALVTLLSHIRGEPSNSASEPAPIPPASTNPEPTSNSHADKNGTTSSQSNHADRDGDGDDDDADADAQMDEFTDASDGPLHTSESKDEPQSLTPRAKFIPLRLSPDERKLLRLVEAALNVSEYTDVVDVISSRAKTKQRVYTQIRDLCSILTGLTVASDYNQGQKLVADRDFAHNEGFFQQAFEIARRHKVANPEKSRDTYGKLIHMLQDSAQAEIVAMLEFSCVKPLRTVASFLEERGGLPLLDDPLVEKATREIIPDKKTRRAVQREISEKERAVAILAKRYRTRALNDDDVRRCLYSIGDNNAYLRAARDPCETMINYLHEYFKMEAPTGRANNLAIANGVGGARLTHDHARQFRYVFQSLALWREACHEMYKLWYLSEKDLLNSGNQYTLRNTGQGLNRVQSAPSVSRAINEILSTVQRRVGQWVGSSVVHLGDYNVPNALVFIDKYAQVQRILGPLCTCIRRMGDVARNDAAIEAYIDNTFGGVECARKTILQDFFRHAFDGSGASDWFSAGSCIDGRLTSAWNWCSEVEKRPYWPLMLLTGFTGFDGDF